MTKKEWAASVDEMWKSAVEFAYKDLIDEAVKAEREACAKVIYDSWESTTAGEGIPEDWLLTLVELIQARGQA